MANTLENFPVILIYVQMHALFEKDKLPYDIYWENNTYKVNGSIPNFQFFSNHQVKHLGGSSSV